MVTTSTTSSDLVSIAQRLASRLGEQLPQSILQLLQTGIDSESNPVQLECRLSFSNDSHGSPRRRTKVASVNIGASALSSLISCSPDHDVPLDTGCFDASQTANNISAGLDQGSSLQTGLQELRPAKRQKTTGGLHVRSTHLGNGEAAGTGPLNIESRVAPRRKKRLPDNPAFQPSTLEKFITGVWDTIFSGVRLDPAEVIEQWQAIETGGQPRLLMSTDAEIVQSDGTIVRGTFGRMSVLARKVTQTSRTCRSLEVIVQAHWVHCFEDRVAELTVAMSREKARRQAIAEACMDFNWTEKELRNKMAIWRGYHDIKSSGGWSALVFAGTGLYRFCKYRVSFTEGTFRELKALRHRFEVAADTLHPRWRQLLAIVGGPTERKYGGHPHEWVVCGPSDEAIPLPETYHQWDRDFTYRHLDQSTIDEEYWGSFDPRTTVPKSSPEATVCEVCSEHQSDNPRDNHCGCFPGLYGSLNAGFTPVQVFRTPNGKNNGLIACCAFERGAAIGEFVGSITSGLANLDVMVGQTEKASYQIWQGRQGNHTRFVNHSCQPNAHYEQFIWLGTQRFVLVSNGVEAGEEITVDYSDTYWKDLDKVCLCRQDSCRYKDRAQHLLTPPDSS